MTIAALQNYLDKVSTEDFVENEEEAPVQEAWVDLPENTMTGVKDGMQTQDVLEELAVKIDGAEDTPSLEAYDWSFRSLTQLQNLAPRVYCSLENFETPILQRDALAKSVREHAQRLGGAIDASLEDYRETFDNDLFVAVQTIQQSSATLKKAIGSISTSTKPKKIDQKKIWQMMHRNGAFIEDLSGAIREERAALDKIMRVLREGASSGELPSLNTKLMFNTTVSIQSNRIDFDRITVSPPRQSKGEVGTGSRWRWTIAGLLLFNVVGAVGGYFIGKHRDNVRAENNTVSEAVTQRQVDDVKAFLEGLADLDRYVADIEKTANAIARQIETEEKETRKELARKLFPVMDGLEHVARHIAELTYGGSVMAGALSS